MTYNPRGRNLTTIAPDATERARKPALVIPKVADPGLARWIGAVSERLELAEGNRNRPIEQTLTRRDLETRLSELGLVIQGVPLAQKAAGAVPVVGKNGSASFMSFEQFAEGIRGTKLFRDLTASIDDPHRFDDLPQRTRDLLLKDIAEEASKRRADIRRLDEKIEDANGSFAQSVIEVTAAVEGAAAGVRQVLFASASRDRATAGLVTQVKARLDNFSGGAPGTATVESKMTAIADRATGLEAQYTLKVATNGAIAGFGLAATTSAAGASTSAMLFLANKFAFITNTDVIGTGAGQINPTNPPANRIMFGIDSNGAYLGGNLKVAGVAVIDGSFTSSTGQTLTALEVGNSSFSKRYGVIAQASVVGVQGYAPSGIGVQGFTNSGAAGVQGNSTGAGPGVLAVNTGGGAAITLQSGHLNLNAAQFTTGGGTATFIATNKPGLAASNEWMRVVKDGQEGWMPWWPTS